MQIPSATSLLSSPLLLLTSSVYCTLYLERHIDISCRPGTYQTIPQIDDLYFNLAVDNKQAILAHQSPSLASKHTSVATMVTDNLRVPREHFAPSIVSRRSSVTLAPSLPPLYRLPHDSSTTIGQTMDLPSYSEATNPINPDIFRYIRALNEPHETYQRFLDGLLVKRAKQGAFFRDLKGFREQGHVVRLLHESNFREVTDQYLASRFAHPWCRQSHFRAGFFKAEWGSIKKAPKGHDKEAENLHALLLPLWCQFRVRMFPTERQLQAWLEEQRQLEEFYRRERQRREQEEAKEADSVGTWLNDVEPNDHSEDDEAEDVPESSDRSRTRNADEQASATDAANMFIGAAATGLFMSLNKRERKYVMKKMKIGGR